MLSTRLKYYRCPFVDNKYRKFLFFYLVPSSSFLTFPHTILFSHQGNQSQPLCFISNSSLVLSLFPPHYLSKSSNTVSYSLFYWLSYLPSSRLLFLIPPFITNGHYSSPPTSSCSLFPLSDLLLVMILVFSLPLLWKVLHVSPD